MISCQGWTIRRLKWNKNILSFPIFGVSGLRSSFTLFFIISYKYDTNTKRTTISISTNSSSKHYIKSQYKLENYHYYKCYYAKNYCLLFFLSSILRLFLGVVESVLRASFIISPPVIAV